MLFQEQYDPLTRAHGINTQKQTFISTINASSGNTTLTTGKRGQTFLFDSATGITYTLPTPTDGGVAGLEYHFIITNTVTSGNHKIITDAATTFLLGAVVTGSAGGASIMTQGDGSANIAVTMNGSTTGGFKGTILHFKSLNSTQWEVSGNNVSGGTPATPFANS